MKTCAFCQQPLRRDERFACDRCSTPGVDWLEAPPRIPKDPN
jgi:predicted amidophosphoribosyltransferase